MNIEKINYNFVDNKKKYCQVIGCKRHFWDPRFCDSPSAVEARDILIELREKGEKFSTLGEKIGVGITTISHVVGGNAGKKAMEKYNGRSTTEYVIDKLRDISRK